MKYVGIIVGAILFGTVMVGACTDISIRQFREERVQTFVALCFQRTNNLEMCLHQVVTKPAQEPAI